MRRLKAAEGRALIALSLATLCARNLQIPSLAYGNTRDVNMCECGRGLQVALVGILPAYRDALECHTFALVVKNGVPIAYGPASVCCGCCEMGINVFPEFRGGETRWVYSQYMRAIHQVLGARHFFVTTYGMGRGNPEAIRTALAFEQAALDGYKELLESAAGDVVLEEFARAQIATESEHVSALYLLLDE